VLLRRRLRAAGAERLTEDLVVADRRQLIRRRVEVDRERERGARKSLTSGKLLRCITLTRFWVRLVAQTRAHDSADNDFERHIERFVSMEQTDQGAPRFCVELGSARLVFAWDEFTSGFR
jgi:hypothetical protein